ncbi:MAG: recombinase family protein [Patescibacteria group bacterium]|nr:recombinase family protein [Patescibacteria group bacterium]
MKMKSSIVNPQSEMDSGLLVLPAILYGRVSTDKQEMDRQTRELEAYCLRPRWNSFQRDDCRLHILTRLYDPDVSGYKVHFAQRKAGAELLTHLGTIPNLQIVTTEQDRIGRDTIDQIQTLRRFWDAGATPHFVLEGGCLERTPENEHRMEMRASDAQYERHKIAGRISSKMRGKRAAGELCGTVTFGWDVEYLFGDGTALRLPNALPRFEREAKERAHRGLVSVRPVDNPEQQQWLLWMIGQWQLATTAWQIANELNARGVKSKRAGELMTVVCSADTPGARPNKSGNGWVVEKPASGLWQAEQVATLLASTTVKDWLNQRKET